MSKYDFDFDTATVCECGVPLDVHPDLPKPPPLRSDMAMRNSDDRLSEAAVRGMAKRNVKGQDYFNPTTRR